MFGALAGVIVSFFFFNDTATTEIYTLSLHDALPICARSAGGCRSRPGRNHRRTGRRRADPPHRARPRGDRKSTRLNSSHQLISYAVFCFKKKKHPAPSCRLFMTGAVAHEMTFPLATC